MERIRYHVPEDGDDAAHPNVFELVSEGAVRVGDVRRHFPLPGRFHLRVPAPRRGPRGLGGRGRRRGAGAAPPRAHPRQGEPPRGRRGARAGAAAAVAAARVGAAASAPPPPPPPPPPRETNCWASARRRRRRARGAEPARVAADLAVGAQPAGPRRAGRGLAARAAGLGRDGAGAGAGADATEQRADPFAAAPPPRRSSALAPEGDLRRLTDFRRRTGFRQHHRGFEVVLAVHERARLVQRRATTSWSTRSAPSAGGTAPSMSHILRTSRHLRAVEARVEEDDADALGFELLPQARRRRCCRPPARRGGRSRRPRPCSA